MRSHRRIRVLAYHEVGEPEAFERQLDWLCLHFDPISAADFLDAVDGRSVLPRRAVWLTFDDGSRTVVDVAKPLLDRRSLRATLFVCPGLIGSTQPFWWQVVERAFALGIETILSREHTGLADVLRELKTQPDEVRRAAVERMSDAIVDRTGAPLSVHQLADADLRAWRSTGHSVGNHSWDHPCLDRCAPDAQRDQIERADEWLERFEPSAPRVFAYPNGRRTEETERCLRELGYSAALLFDHRLAHLAASPLRISRLRISSAAPLARFRAITSGLHPLLFHAVGKS